VIGLKAEKAAAALLERCMVEGDPMEGALVALAAKAGLEPASERKALPRTDEIPFDSLHRYMATLHHDHRGQAFVLIKVLDADGRPVATARTNRSGIFLIQVRGAGSLAAGVSRTKVFNVTP
jgi:magnesium-transporting ATPase (P-type)